MSSDSSRRKDITLSFFYLLFSFILFFRLGRQIFGGFPKEGWSITEFLINYQGGFVRRGMLGELILKAYQFLAIPPYTFIIVLSGLAFFILILFFLRYFIKEGYPIFYLPFVFFLGNPVFNAFWVRKDVLIILIFISVIVLAIQKWKYSIIFLNLILITGVLIHESVFFISIPILLLILKQMHGNLNPSFPRFVAWIKPFGLILPSLVSFVLIVLNKGTLQISERIWNSWDSVFFPFHTKAEIPSTAIEALSWSTDKGLSMTASVFLNFNDKIYAPLAWLFILGTIYFLLININRIDVKVFGFSKKKDFNREMLSAILIFQFFCILPLSVLGYDYGRWIFYWVTSSFVLILVVPEKLLYALIPKWISNTALTFTNFFDLYIGSSRAVIFLMCLFIGFPVCNWPGISYTNSSTIVVLSQFVSGLIFKLMVFLGLVT